VTVTGNAPVAAVGAALNAKMASALVPVVTFELTPEGRPVTAKARVGTLLPLVADAVRLTEDELPAWRCTEPEDSEKEKSPSDGPGLNVMSRTGCSSMILGAAPC